MKKAKMKEIKVKKEKKQLSVDNDKARKITTAGLVTSVFIPVIGHGIAAFGLYHMVKNQKKMEADKEAVDKEIEELIIQQKTETET